MKKGGKLSEVQTDGHISQNQYSEAQKSSKGHFLENLRLAPG